MNLRKLKFRFQLGSRSRQVRVSILILGGYLIAYFGYQFAASHNDPAPKGTVLVYKTNLTMGSVVRTRDLVPIEKALRDSVEDFVFAQDRPQLKDIPLLRDAKAGEPVRRSDFLGGLEGDMTLGARYRSLWIPQPQTSGGFREGSRLELYESGGAKIASDSILMKKEDSALLVALPRDVLPQVVKALERGGIVVTLKYSGGDPEKVRIEKSRIQHRTLLIF